MIRYKHIINVHLEQMKHSENPLTTANVLDIQIELLSFSE